MTTTPRIVVLCGAESSEREVSLQTGRAVYEALAPRRPARLVELERNELPEDVSPADEIVFPALHGRWGEDGQLQAILEKAGIEYVGCDAASSERCMNKERVRQVALSNGIAVANGFTAPGERLPTADEVVEACGDDVVIKPVADGSSVGLHLVEGRESIDKVLRELDEGHWLFERRIPGRELSVGVLEEQPLSVVEICPAGGVYDYKSKYTKGATIYHCPADLPEQVTANIRSAAQAIFRACGCRDFARVDFRYNEQDGPILLEINTLPGMTPMSLLPKSAAHALALDFPNLVERMITPAMRRFAQRTQ